MRSFEMMIMVEWECFFIAIENDFVASVHFAITDEVSYQLISKSISPVLMIYNNVFNVARSSASNFIFYDDTAITNDFVIQDSNNAVGI